MAELEALRAQVTAIQVSVATAVSKLLELAQGRVNPAELAALAGQLQTAKEQLDTTLAGLPQ